MAEQEQSIDPQLEDKKEKPVKSPDSISIRGVLIGIGVTVLIAILIGSFSLLMDNMESNLRDSIQKSLKAEFEPIKNELRQEREKRIQLAAILMKNKTLEIPVNLLTNYENIQQTETLRLAFKKRIKHTLSTISAAGIDSLGYLNGLNNKATLIAPFDNDEVIVAITSEYTSNQNNSYLANYGLTDNWLNILNSKKVHTGNLYLMGVQEILKQLNEQNESNDVLFYTCKFNNSIESTHLNQFRLTEFNAQYTHQSEIGVNDTLRSIFRSNILNAMKIRYSDKTKVYYLVNEPKNENELDIQDEENN